MFQGLSKTSRRAGMATLIISTVLLFGSMTAPLLARIGSSFPDMQASGQLYQILTIPALVAMFVSFLVGPVAMKVNLKILMAITAICALIYFLIFAFVGSNNFNLLIVGAGIMGVTQGAAMVLTSSIFGAFIPNPAVRANFVAISGALMNGGAAVVNILGGVIAATNNGLNWPLAYYLGLLIIPALIVFWIMMPKAPDPADAAAGPGHGDVMPAQATTGGIPLRAWLIVAMGTIVALGMATFLLNVGLFIELEKHAGGPAEAGLTNSLWTIFGVLAGFSFPVVVRFLKNWIAVLGYAVGAAGLIVLAMSDSIFPIYVAASLMGLGFNIAMPYVMGQLMAVTPGKFIPIIMSVNMGLMNLCFFVMPMVMGALTAPFGSTLTMQMIFAAGLVVIGVVFATILFVMVKGKAPAAPAEAPEAPKE